MDTQKEPNNKIKVLKRISYGLRHFGRFRVRILLLSKKMAPTINMIGAKEDS